MRLIFMEKIPAVHVYLSNFYWETPYKMSWISVLLLLRNPCYTCISCVGTATALSFFSAVAIARPFSTTSTIVLSSYFFFNFSLISCTISLQSLQIWSCGKDSIPLDKNSKNLQLRFKYISKLKALIKFILGLGSFKFTLFKTLISKMTVGFLKNVIKLYLKKLL